jgi:hypothetical protein
MLPHCVHTVATFFNLLLVPGVPEYRTITEKNVGRGCGLWVLPVVEKSDELLDHIIDNKTFLKLSSKKIQW